MHGGSYFVVRASDVDRVDDLALFTERHLGLLIAIVGPAIPDPVLAFDIASEATAQAYNGAPARPDELRAVLDAVEHVFRASLASGRVPGAERHRVRDARPTMLSEQARASIMSLVRERLPDGSPARQAADVLARDAPSAAELHRIQGSGLVQAPGQPARTRADEGPRA